ncbi:MAG TPA: hypothetical protein VJI46_01570 [Candidatus Nanoarchaeia archaeon]|nr:hypothetical protein [Candidatus Nanoarchaeia archaeon]
MILRCPRCKHTMKYQPQTKFLKDNKKSCVYCGKSFLVKKSIVKT